MRKLCVLLVAAGCHSPVAISMDGVATPFVPPAWYEEVYSAVEECAGVRGDPSAVRWLIAEHVYWYGEPHAAVWRPPHDIIFERTRETWPPFVAHEMLHHILQEGANAHESAVFKRCAPDDGYLAARWGSPEGR